MCIEALGSTCDEIGIYGSEEDGMGASISRSWNGRTVAIVEERLEQIAQFHERAMLEIQDTFNAPL